MFSFFLPVFSRFRRPFWKSNASVVQLNGHKTNFAQYWRLFNLKVEKKDFHLVSGQKRGPRQGIVIVKLINSGQVRLGLFIVRSNMEYEVLPSY